METNNTDYKSKDYNWRQKLTEEQYKVMREGEPELPYTGDFLQLKKSGVYVCAGCESKLFSSKDKYDYGTGWLSFSKPLNIEVLSLKKDSSLGTEQTGLLCNTCGSHIGHVFEYGPESKGDKRYSVYSCAVSFIKDKK